MGNLDGVGEAIAEMIGKPFTEDLGFIFQAAKGAGVDNAIAVALKLVAIRVRWLRVTPAPQGVYGIPEPCKWHWSAG